MKVNSPRLTLAAVLFNLAFLIMIPTSPAQACSCMQLDSKDLFDSSRHVVFGKLENIQTLDNGRASADFVGMQVFKGRLDYVKRVIGAAKDNSAACDVALSESYYLIFTRDAKDVAINLCSASRKVEQSEIVSRLSQLQGFADGGKNATGSKANLAAKPLGKAKHLSEQSLEGEVKDAKQTPINESIWDQFLQFIGWE